jgi:hypothetical protein
MRDLFAWVDFGEQHRGLTADYSDQHQNLEPAPARLFPQRFDTPVNKPVFAVGQVFGSNSFPLLMRNCCIFRKLL